MLNLPPDVAAIMQRDIDRGDYCPPRPITYKPDFSATSADPVAISLTKEIIRNREVKEAKPPISLTKGITGEISLANSELLGNLLANEICTQQGQHATHAAKAAAPQASLHSADKIQISQSASPPIVPKFDSITRMRIQVFPIENGQNKQTNYRMGLRNLKIEIWGTDDVSCAADDRHITNTVYFNLMTPSNFKKAVSRNIKSGAIAADIGENLTMIADHQRDENMRADSRLEASTLAYLTQKGSQYGIKGTKLVPHQVAVLDWSKDADGGIQANVTIYWLDTLERQQFTCPKAKPRTDRKTGRRSEYIGFHDPIGYNEYRKGAKK
jgi:hypothetical protein